jgi:taurine dioxygenase
VYEHEWHEGELLIWDNMTTMHCRTSFDANHRRVMRRLSIMRTAEGPQAAGFTVR